RRVHVGVYDHRAATLPGTLTHHRPEIGGTVEPVRPWKHPPPGRDQAVSAERPLRRRAATMPRPARVRMRRRNPCTLARRRLFGWKVRLPLAMVGSSHEVGTVAGTRSSSRRRRTTDGGTTTRRTPLGRATDCSRLRSLAAARQTVSSHSPRAHHFTHQGDTRTAVMLDLRPPPVLEGCPVVHRVVTVVHHRAPKRDEHEPSTHTTATNPRRSSPRSREEVCSLTAVDNHVDIPVDPGAGLWIECGSRTTVRRTRSE